MTDRGAVTAAKVLHDRTAPIDPQAAEAHTISTMAELLHTVRQHLGMEIGFVSEFTEGRRVFRYVDTAPATTPILEVGASDPLEDSYCQRVVDGRLPELIPDARAVPAAMELAVTTALPVGAHLSVPIRLSDGSVYGTFCCFSHTPDRTLNERDLKLLRVFAEMAGKNIDRDLAAHVTDREIEARVRSALDGDILSIAYQPIYHLGRHAVVGFEALSRFAVTPPRSPDIWFNEAAKVGLGPALEMKAIRMALNNLPRFPAHAYVSVNASPESILSGDVENALTDLPLDRIVLEITEHAAVGRYRDIATILSPLRDNGLRLAVDDAGAGFASFRHILSLAPDVIKLDMSITRNIHVDKSRRALASALIRFSQETGAKLIAEGIETAAELEVLQELGAIKGQGYLLGKPQPLDAALQLC